MKASELSESLYRVLAAECETTEQAELVLKTLVTGYLFQNTLSKQEALKKFATIAAEVATALSRVTDEEIEHYVPERRNDGILQKPDLDS